MVDRKGLLLSLDMFKETTRKKKKDVPTTEAIKKKKIKTGS